MPELGPYGSVGAPGERSSGATRQRSLASAPRRQARFGQYSDTFGPWACLAGAWRGPRLVGRAVDPAAARSVSGAESHAFSLPPLWTNSRNCPDTGTGRHCVAASADSGARDTAHSRARQNAQRREVSAEKVAAPAPERSESQAPAGGVVRPALASRPGRRAQSGSRAEATKERTPSAAREPMTPWSTEALHPPRWADWHDVCACLLRASQSFLPSLRCSRAPAAELVGCLQNLSVAWPDATHV